MTPMYAALNTVARAVEKASRRGFLWELRQTA